MANADGKHPQFLGSRSPPLEPPSRADAACCCLLPEGGARPVARRLSHGGCTSTCYTVLDGVTAREDDRPRAVNWGGGSPEGHALTAAGVLCNQRALCIDHSNCLTKLFCLTVSPLWLPAAGEEEGGRQPSSILLPRLLGAHIPSKPQSPKPNPQPPQFSQPTPRTLERETLPDHALSTPDQHLNRTLPFSSLKPCTCVFPAASLR